jgi:hypothetical protein
MENFVAPFFYYSHRLYNRMKKALLIGINYYDISNITLNGCINDVININNMLIDAYNYSMENIIILRDDSLTNDLFTDDSLTNVPTRENIIRNLKELIDKSNECEEIWIHYSGHGSRIPSLKDTFDEVIVPIDYKDTGFIVDNDLFDIIKESKCRTILIIDCCHSATMFDLEWCFEYDTNIQAIQKHRNNTDIITNKSIFMLSGCKDKETSSDTFNVETEQYTGALTNAFIYCLRKNHHNITFMQLYREILLYLVKKGFSQKPVFSSSSENLEGSFIRSPSILFSYTDQKEK